MRNLVVGVDGSPSSARALEWAVTTVGPEGTLHVVTSILPETELPAEPITGHRAEYRERLAHQLDAVWLAPVRGRAATISTTIAEGTAAHALRAAAAANEADAIVVGSHVPAPVLPKTIGTTVRHLLPELTCPLIVVPDTSEGTLDDARQVVVGVGYGEGTEAAVRWAAELAERRDLPICLVRATGEGPVFSVDGFLYLLAYYVDPTKRAQWTKEDLDELAGEIQELTGNGVAVEVSARPGLPARRLVDASKKAALLVIGQRRSMVTGDTHATQPLRHALTHARCPVAIIPLGGA